MDDYRQSAWAIIRNPVDQILILKRSNKCNNPGLYNLPGGGIDKNETPKQAIIREVFEEAGIKLPSISFTRVIIDDNRHMHFFSFKLAKEVKVKIDFESSKYEWMSEDDIKKLKRKLHIPTRKYFG